MAKVITECRVCGLSKLTPILSLGDLFVSNFIDDPHRSHQDKYPLDLVLCAVNDGGCGLLQLRHTVPVESLYRNYWYRSGMNKTMTDELQGIAAKAQALAALSAGDCVIDIGANDGTLLRGYTVGGLNTVGFEPARNLGEYNSVGTTKIINDFFNRDAFVREYGSKKAKVITAIAMFYDLDDPNAFVSEAAACLDKEGVFIIQMSYLPLMLSQNAFDNVCHEHLEYYSLLSLENLLRRHNLEVFDAELNDVNGGSFRVYIRHQGQGKTLHIPEEAGKHIQEMRLNEQKLDLGNQGIYEAFVGRVKDIGRRLSDFIKQEASKGKKIYVYGASTKGNTLLQYYGLTGDLITAAAERNKDKWGKKTVGTFIPIISEDQARTDKPDYFLVLPWHFMKEFAEREKAFLERGGKFIVPLPEFKIIGHTDNL